MSRIDFSPATRRLIADRAGHQCSFPTCNRRTIGPGLAADEVSGSGIAAHIYSASPGGPRGQSGLSPEELAQPENAIWLCSDHAKLVDNNRGTAFPPETLLSYKALQEARVVREVLGMYPPVGWIHEVTFYENPLFQTDQKIRLAKLNLVFGENGSGKTALTEWLAGCFDSSYLNRLYADVDGTYPGLPLMSLSGRETERIFIEFATAAARVSGRYTPTLLILDGCPLILFNGIFDFYSHHLLDPENQFQTIMCIPSRELDLDSLKWKGWEGIVVGEFPFL